MCVNISAFWLHHWERKFAVYYHKLHTGWFCFVFVWCLTSQSTAMVMYWRSVYETTLFMPPKELWEAYSNRTVRPSVSQSVPLRVRSISPIFFEEGIPNLVCGCILGWRSVAYQFRVTVTLTLTSDLVFRIIVSGAYLLYYLRYKSQIWCVHASWDDEVSGTIIGSLWPWTWPLT